MTHMTQVRPRDQREREEKEKEKIVRREADGEREEGLLLCCVAGVVMRS